MELSDFAEIKELPNADSRDFSSDTIVKMVNELLNKGWVIINTYTTCYEPTISKEHQTMHYVLGITYQSKLEHELFDKNGSKSISPNE